jgi:hypothetical protein
MLIALAFATWMTTIKCETDTSLLLVCKGSDELCVATMTKLKDSVDEKKCTTEIKILD